ncbi:MAG: TetR/AcrR family transcriptional regulator [Myxococcales bacterium]|nr:MAG: TetR/AcrR family transcriptional regulator [Myxococcales bacterium]
MKKSDRSRQAILAAARQLFAKQGYEATTVREVAERAQIDPAMVIRYFGSKDGLFAQAASVELQLPSAAHIAAPDIGRALLEHFLEIWEGAASKQGMAVLLRSAASNSYAATKMREAFLAQVMPFITALGDPATAPRRAGPVATQLLGLAVCRYVLKLPPVVELSRAELVAALGPTLQRYALGAAGS